MGQTYAAPVDDGWRIPEPLWERLEPLLPRRRRPSPKGGRPPLPWRPVLDGIFFVLRTGCQWKAAPQGFGSGSSLHRYFQQLVRRKVFRRLWQAALEEYDALKGIDWEWQSLDGCMTKAPLGGKKDGQKPHGPSQEGHQTQSADRWPRRARGRGRQWREPAGQRVGARHGGQYSGGTARTHADGTAAPVRRQSV